MGAELAEDQGAELAEDEDQDQGAEDGPETDAGAEDDVWVSQAAAGLLRFSSPRDPALVAQFVSLRVIDPEKAYWRRGIEAATRWRRENGGGQLRVPYDYVMGEDESAGAGFPLGRWLADLRRYYNAGTLEASRVAQLDALGMVWSHHDVAWEEGLTVARSWAAAHGHFLPPVNAVGDGGYPIGVWAKNRRAEARRTWENAEQRAAGETMPVGAGELPESRMAALEAIDPGWCPMGWTVAWQRCFTLTRTHVRAGGTLPEAAGELLVQGEDLGAWVAAQRQGWGKLSPAQQWLLGSTLGLEPAAPGAQSGKLTADGKWALNLRAARQYHAREGHLRPARKHVERLDVDGQAVDIKLGTFLDNTRRRADKLTPNDAPSWTSSACAGSRNGHRGGGQRAPAAPQCQPLGNPAVNTKHPRANSLSSSGRRNIPAQGMRWTTRSGRTGSRRDGRS
ncbi:helicase associated domain-containing protein [Streptomyces olivaceoviridis]|uniref:helicase associated domain-containing protein n=1 Tax=Streptomyces olivaceoviridis TaxID=1921 RepID=UPI0037A0BCBB